jgi:hypothetical protein
MQPRIFDYSGSASSLYLRQTWKSLNLGKTMQTCIWQTTIPSLLDLAGIPEYKRGSGINFQGRLQEHLSGHARESGQTVIFLVNEFFSQEKTDLHKQIHRRFGWRQHEKGVSSLQEPPGGSISARKPAFPCCRQGNKVQFFQSLKKQYSQKGLAPVWCPVQSFEANFFNIT